MTCLMNEWPDPGAHGGAPVLLDRLGHDLRADQVVEDGGPGVLGQHGPGHQGGGERARHRLGPLVDEEDAVGVAVEGQADVGAVLEHRLLQVDEVLGLDRVGRVVGEGAVELRDRAS